MSGSTNAGPASGRLGLAVRVVEVALGALFLLAAVLKLQDANLFVFQIFQYKVFSDPTALGMVAVFTLFLEMVLGLAMLLGIRLRGLVSLTVLGMLLFFTVLIAIVWPEDCGCFGKVKMGPEVSIAKNLVMMAAAALILYGGRTVHTIPSFFTARIAASLVAGLAAAAYAYPQVFQDSTKTTVAEAPAVTAPAPAVQPAPSAAPAPPGEAPAKQAPAPAAAPPTPAAAPYAGYVIESEYGETFDLSKGDYLVVSLAMTCEHCMASVPILNELTFDGTLPRLVCIALEQAPGEKDQFVATTQPMFPIHSLGNNFLEFSRLIVDSPPRLALVRNGVPVLSWEKELPPAAEISTAVAGVLSPTQ